MTYAEEYRRVIRASYRDHGSGAASSAMAHRRAQPARVHASGPTARLNPTRRRHLALAVGNIASDNADIEYLQIYH